MALKNNHEGPCTLHAKWQNCLSLRDEDHVILISEQRGPPRVNTRPGSNSFSHAPSFVWSEVCGSVCLDLQLFKHIKSVKGCPEWRSCWKVCLGLHDGWGQSGGEKPTAWRLLQWEGSSSASRGAWEVWVKTNVPQPGDHTSTVWFWMEHEGPLFLHSP